MSRRPEKQLELDELYKRLLAFKQDSNVGVKSESDLLGFWILDEEEGKHIDAVLELLLDCGANE